ncbi:hypothetical protein [Streptomyces laculatispora]|uniref:hypothetical protein n=1 Tax=Streptomyces laculatispora TaxID=887464 RepID=UPI001A9496F0|nr:hypothetical protein [Streptomyces laculatispora]
MPLAVTAVAIPLYGLWAALFATGGGDLAAQLAWAGFMARHPGSAYNLSWHGGIDIFNYSVLAPVAMATFGVRTVSVAAGLAGTWALAALFFRAKVRGALWAALLGALAVWCNVASGRTTFALGAAVGLLALLALQISHRRVAMVTCAVLAALSACASPVAGVFLTVAGAAYLLDRQWAKAASLIAPPIVLTGAVTLLFPFYGEQPMPRDKLWVPLTLCAALWCAAPHGWRLVRCGAVAYAVGVLATFSLASPMGANVDRLAILAGPPVLLAALLTHLPIRAPRHALPHAVLAAMLATCAAWMISNTYDDVTASSPLPSWAEHTDGVIAALARLHADRTRVEAVPTGNHREAYLLAPHVNMARGWNRQLDVERGHLFYDGTFSAAKYRAWLDRWAVGLVVVAAGRPDDAGLAEANLVKNPPGWLKRVWRDNGWVIYRLQEPEPLVSAPATALHTNEAGLVVHMPSPGSTIVRIAYSPWLSAPGACVERAGAWTRLTAPGRGDYQLGSAYRLPRLNGCG